MKLTKNCTPSKYLIFLVATIVAVLVLSGACRRVAGGDIDDEEGTVTTNTYNPKNAYPISVTAKLAQFAAEDGSEHLQITDFPLDIAAPVLKSSVSSAKKGTQVTISIPALAGHKVSGGLTHIEAESGEKVSLNSQNKFTMPSGSVAVTVVYIKEEDIFKVPTFYSNALYSLDIAHGEVANNLPNPILNTFNTGGVPYGATIDYAGYPDVDIKPLPLNGYAASSWGFADASWSDTTINNLHSSEDQEYFFIKVKVKPQALVEYPTIDKIPAAVKNLYVNGTSSTVEQMYSAAQENVYHFKITRLSPTVDVLLYSINIQGVSEVYTDQLKTSVPVGPFGSGPEDYTTQNFYAFPPFGSTEVSVTVETNNPSSKVKIDNGAYSFGSGSAEVVYPGGETETQFTVTVQAEDESKQKMYIVTLENEESLYTAEAEGGLVYYIKDFSTGKVTEIHSFSISSKDDIETGAQKSFSLSFKPESKPTSVEILVVGGGGSGGNFVSGRPDGKTGSGGAGGVIYLKNYTLGSENTYIVKVGNGGGSGLSKGVNDTFTADGQLRIIEAAQKGGDSSFSGGSDSDPNRLVAPGGGGGANNSNGGTFYGGKGGSSGGHVQGNSRGGYWYTISTPLLDFYYAGSYKQPNGTVNADFTPLAGSAWGHMGVVRDDDWDRRHCSWAGGGAGSEPQQDVRTGFWQAGTDYGRGIKINITGSEIEYARSHLSGQGNPSAGAQKTGSGGGGGSNVNGATGGSGIVVVKWVRES